MKKLVLSLVLMQIMSFSVLAIESKPSAQCEAQARAMVRAAVTVSRGSVSAKEAQYSVTQFESEPKMDWITIQAFGIDGEDSDTYLEYKVGVRKLQTSGFCYGIKSMNLVAEN